MIRHDPPRSWGDCHRQCIAFMLGLRWQDVPHFYDNGTKPEDAHAHIQFWLARRGLIQLHVPFSSDGSTKRDVMMAVAFQNPGVQFILGGESRTGCGHSVVAHDGMIVFDSHASGIVGPMEDGFYWVTFLGSIKGMRL